eukprot:m.38563 g.38563  ORF g.38563 m.38563 type:complete len:634 (-) comp11191_c0_seq3:338-2239(-)
MLERLFGEEGPSVGAVATGAVAGVVGVATVAYLRLFHTFGTVEKDSTQHGGHLVASVLKAHGVKFIFTLVGGHISPILVACEASDIRVVDTRHEVTAVFAADAVARMSGVPGVAAVTAGPGLTNTVTAVKNAQMAESPLVLLGGAAATLLKGRGSLQDIDQMSLFKPLCKFCATVTRVKDIVPTLRKAFAAAQSGVPGPVFVELPIDALYPYATVEKVTVPPKKEGQARTIGQRVIDAYLANYLNSLFADAFVPRPVTPLPVDVPIVSVSKVSQAAQLLRSAKRPVVLVGSQATLPPTPAGDVRAALEAMGIPCYLGGMSRGLLGRNGRLHVRQERRTTLREADVIVLAGTVADFRLDYGRSLGRKATIIAVNRDSKALHKNSDLFWKPHVACVGDVGTFVKDVAAELARLGYGGAPDEWLQKLRERNDAKESTNKVKADEPMKPGFLNPLKLHYQLEDVMADDSVLVADGGDFVGTAAYILRPRGPLGWLDPGAFGTLGVGGGFALGAKLCRPDADVWIIYGDGSLGYSVAEFDTFARHKLPVIALVGNDACWTQIAREQVPMFQSDVACALVHNDYHVVADGYGGKGLLLNSDTETKATLQEALEVSRGGMPVLVNAIIGTTNFREGSISV